METINSNVHVWRVQVPVGDTLGLEWTMSASVSATLQIYDGYSEFSTNRVDRSINDSTYSDQLVATGFQLVVKVTSTRRDSRFRFEATYGAKDWNPVLSGCYRPWFSSRTDRVALENNVVLPDQPVVVMVSETTYDKTNPGYGAGLYCKWTIRGQPGSRISMSFLDIDVPPHGDTCVSDGLVVYDGNTTMAPVKGPYCGASEKVQKMTLTSTGPTMVVVFYSDTRGPRRSDCMLRAIFTSAGPSSCDQYTMETSTSTTKTSRCGVFLSPGFPGQVSPGLWSWVLKTDLHVYFAVSVHYVRGPAIPGQCNEFFRLIEIAKDSGKLRQYETTPLKLCEDTDLFIAQEQIKIPPGQKLGIELSTIRTTLPRRWEFKLSYSTAYMEKPPFTESTTSDGSCPTYYDYYRGHCYRYYMWTDRHYEPIQSAYHKTWQTALDHCQSENATLFAIKDEDDATWLKYQLSNKWFVDPSATWQVNHRLIYLGLTSRNGRYKWLDGTLMSYNDWYQPRKPWEQTIVHEDMVETMEFLGLRTPEPKSDFGSLCTVILAVSPFTSLNWAKVPCDYPLFFAGIICEKVANTQGSVQAKGNKEVNQTYTLQQYQEKGYIGCPRGWIYVQGTCYQMFTDYDKVIQRQKNSESKVAPPGGMSVKDAEQVCQTRNGRMARMNTDLFTVFVKFLDLWRHKVYMGNIWLSTSNSTCKFIEVYKNHRLSTEVRYRLQEGECVQFNHDGLSYNVLCQTAAITFNEDCGLNEFRCGNGVCISYDYYCDGENDCLDNTDEVCSDCGRERFRCQNGRCISMSLFCDFRNDCGDNSDEDNCVHEACPFTKFRCNNGQCIDVKRVCDFKVHCLDGSDEGHEACHGRCRDFQCFSGQCIPEGLHHDMVSDCAGLAREDETQYAELQTLFTIYTENLREDENTTFLGCPEPDQVFCQLGHERCFSRAETCQFDTFAAIEGLVEVQQSCRDGSHVRKACGDMTCDGVFHCPDAYFVPYNKVCDGIRDCPSGQDEENCLNYTCHGLLQCKGETYCLPHSKVCDGEVHCKKYGEDERYCKLEDVLCVEPCVCRGHVLTCSNSSLSSLRVPDDTTTRTLRVIILSHNQLNITVESFLHLHWLGKLDLSHNKLSYIPHFAFSHLRNLFELDLSDNAVSSIQPQVFTGLTSLRILNLHNNLVSCVDRSTFSPLASINHLILTENPMDDVTENTFDSVSTLSVLNTDAFKFCCIAKHVVSCSPEPDEFSSCEDLMANAPLQISIWVLGIFAFFGNLFVVIWRVKTDRSKISSFFIINLGCSDLLMGVYLLIIAGVDIYYRGVYIIYAEKWRSSTLCQLAGFLAMLSSEVSVYMLTVITGDRLYAILFPLRIGTFRMAHARGVVIAGWIGCFVLSLLPALRIAYFGDSFFGRTGVCLPFQLTNEHPPGWEYSVFIFLVLNLISFIFIAIGYAVIFISVKSAAQRMGNKSTAATDEYALAKKLMLIVASDLICWVPIILIGFAALGGVPVPPQVSAWVAVFVLPLNSAVNPILYTMSALDCSGGRKKRQAMTTAASSATLRTGVSETSIGTKSNELSVISKGKSPPQNSI